jgi:hypothetical protein
MISLGNLLHLSDKLSLCQNDPTRFIRCFLNIKLMFRSSRPCSRHFIWVLTYPLRACALFPPVSPLLLCPICILPSLLWKVSDLSCSFCHKEARVCRSLWYFKMTSCSYTILPFMVVVDDSTTSPFFIN